MHQIGLPCHLGRAGLVDGRRAPTTSSAFVADPNVQIQESQGVHLRRPPGPAARPRGTAAPIGAVARSSAIAARARSRRSPSPRHATASQEAPDGRAKGFFTDATRLHRLQGLRGGVQAVEPAARGRPRFTGMSYDNTGAARRHHLAPRGLRRAGAASARGDGGADASFSWLMMTDVCKHCEHAGCLDACPTGRDRPHRVRLGRTPARRLQRLRLLRAGCPFGVIDRLGRRRPRLEVHALLRPARGGLKPACAKACPTDSIQFGARRAARAAPRAGRAAARARRDRGLPLRRDADASPAPAG